MQHKLESSSPAAQTFVKTRISPKYSLNIPFAAFQTDTVHYESQNLFKEKVVLRMCMYEKNYWLEAEVT